MPHGPPVEQALEDQLRDYWQQQQQLQHEPPPTGLTASGGGPQDSANRSPYGTQQLPPTAGPSHHQRNLGRGYVQQASGQAGDSSSKSPSRPSDRGWQAERPPINNPYLGLSVIPSDHANFGTSPHAQPAAVPPSSGLSRPEDGLERYDAQLYQHSAQHFDPLVPARQSSALQGAADGATYPFIPAPPSFSQSFPSSSNYQQPLHHNPPSHQPLQFHDPSHSIATHHGMSVYPSSYGQQQYLGGSGPGPSTHYAQDPHQQHYPSRFPEAINTELTYRDVYQQNPTTPVSATSTTFSAEAISSSPGRMSTTLDGRTDPSFSLDLNHTAGPSRYNSTSKEFSRSGGTGSLQSGPLHSNLIPPPPTLRMIVPLRGSSLSGPSGSMPISPVSSSSGGENLSRLAEDAPYYAAAGPSIPGSSSSSGLSNFNLGLRRHRSVDPSNVLGGRKKAVSPTARKGRDSITSREHSNSSGSVSSSSLPFPRGGGGGYYNNDDDYSNNQDEHIAVSDQYRAEEILKQLRGRAADSKEGEAACDRCRRRKIRCDRIKPSCARCLSAGKECTTTDALRKRGPPSKKERAFLASQGISFVPSRNRRRAGTTGSVMEGSSAAAREWMSPSTSTSMGALASQQTTQMGPGGQQPQGQQQQQMMGGARPPLASNLSSSSSISASPLHTQYPPPSD